MRAYHLLSLLPSAEMASFLIVLCLSSLLFPSVILAAPPRTPIDVAFQKNYVPTWAYDHIKYLNGGSEVHLVLDKYTGKITEKNSSKVQIPIFQYIFLCEY